MGTSSIVQSKTLGNECIQTSAITATSNATTVQHDNNNNATETYHQINQQSDNSDNFNFDDQLDVGSNDDEQSSEPSNDASASGNYSQHRVKFSSPKSAGEVDDRRLRRQIANCNERRRMQSINAGFQALRQFLPQRCGEKLSKAAILQQTAELIQSLQLGRRSADQSKPTSDEEANADRPQCKKRRIAQKQVKQEDRVPEAGHLEIAEYLKIIEGLREALNKEQQLRLLYEQKFTDLKTTLSASLGFGSLPSGINLDRNENIQQPPIHQRSNSADGLLVPKPTQCDNPTSTLLYNNLAAVTEAALNYNNQMRMARQATNGALSALLSPTQQLNGLHFGSSSPFAQQPLQNVVPFVNLLAASLQSPHDGHPLAPQQIPPAINQSPSNGMPQNTLYAIAEALRQIENDFSKGENLSTASPDLMVR